ncbi:MAG: hypothetical protein WD354_12045 [Acidimicrobiia bacterium]
MGRHLLRHVTVMAVAVGILVIVGVPWSTAFTFGLVAGCMMMAFGMDHSGHSAEDSETKGARTDEVHRH